jgi:hypothetical protein
LLEELEPHLVHPNRCKVIASARLKNTKVDADTLAQRLRADLLPEAGSGLTGAVLVEARDEWQISDRRYLSEGSMALLTATTKEVAPAQLMPAYTPDADPARRQRLHHPAGCHLGWPPIRPGHDRTATYPPACPAGLSALRPRASRAGP